MNVQRKSQRLPIETLKRWPNVFQILRRIALGLYVLDDDNQRRWLIELDVRGLEALEKENKRLVETIEVLKCQKAQMALDLDRITAMLPKQKTSDAKVRREPVPYGPRDRNPYENFASKVMKYGQGVAGGSYGGGKRR